MPRLVWSSSGGLCAWAEGSCVRRAGPSGLCTFHRQALHGRMRQQGDTFTSIGVDERPTSCSCDEPEPVPCLLAGVASFQTVQCGRCFRAIFDAEGRQVNSTERRDGVRHGGGAEETDGAGAADGERHALPGEDDVVLVR